MAHEKHSSKKSIAAPPSRRRHERCNCETDASVHEIDKSESVGEAVQCRVKDLSQSGMGVLCRRMFHIGSTIVVVLKLKSGPSRPFFGVVRQCRYADAGLYLVGMEFRAAMRSPAVTRWMSSRGLTPGN